MGGTLITASEGCEALTDCNINRDDLNRPDLHTAIESIGLFLKDAVT